MQVSLTPVSQCDSSLFEPLFSVKLAASPKSSMHAQMTQKHGWPKISSNLTTSSYLSCFFCLEMATPVSYNTLSFWQPHAENPAIQMQDSLFCAFSCFGHPLLWFQEPWSHSWLKPSMKKQFIKTCQTAYFNLSTLVRSDSLKTQPRLLSSYIPHGSTTATV